MKQTVGAIRFGIMKRMINRDACATEIIDCMPESVPNASIYVGIGRLVKAKLIEYSFDAHDGQSRGRPRKYYKLTDKGRSLLEVQEAIHG